MGRPAMPPPPRRTPPPPPAGSFGPTGGYVPPVRVTGGFGPAGSGNAMTGQTPVPVRPAEPEPEQAPKAAQPVKRPSYLVEGDDDEMFGNDSFTAPPVIGE